MREDESDGVVQILLSDGNELCSGALLNSTAQDFKPYVLTAFHCIDIGDPTIPHRPPFYNDPDEGNGELEQYEIDESAEWLVRFEFKHTTCGGSTIGTIYTFDDTNYRAGWDSTDFALVELQDNILRDEPSVGEKVWLGWDRSGNIPTTGFGIHHPAGDIMKHSAEIDPFSTSIFSVPSLSRIHLTNGRVVNFDNGITQGGSSGSPIFDQNERIVGQLTGNQYFDNNQSECSQPRAEYGKFHLSWTGGGTDETRLSNWLQPSGFPTATTLNSLRQPTPQYSTDINLLCSTTILSVTNLAPGYYLHHWNSSNVTLSSSTANPVQVTPGSSGAGWIEAVVHTGWGTITMERINFWVGKPTNNDIDFGVYFSNPPNNVIARNDYEAIGILDNPNETLQHVSKYNWQFGGWSSFITSYQSYPLPTHSAVELYLYNYAPSSQIVLVYAENTCGTDMMMATGKMFYTDDYNGFFMVLSPNPTSGEATLTIKTASEEVALDENTEWDFEVYSSAQILKEKKTKLKGTTTIQTNGWKEGVYVVRVKYKDEVLTGKLVVKK